MTECKSIQEHWLELEALFCAPDAALSQRRDMRICFFAGSQAVLVELMNLAGVPEEEAVAVLTRYHKEAQDFADQFKPLPCRR